MASEQNTPIAGAACIQLESINRITKLPVVESTIETSKQIYEKVKELNRVTKWTITTAENTVSKVVEIGKPYATPIVTSLERPIKKVDGMLCNGLDYVESKIPGVKLPPAEIYNSTKDYFSNSATIMTACALAKPAMDTAKTYVEPAMATAKNTYEGAKQMVEPAFEGAKQMVDPAVQNAKHMVERAQAFRDYGTQRVGRFLYTTIWEENEENVECVDCQGDCQKDKHQ